jgi:decaprenylphospho-beta-D-erythro-pentofuranosid-2-ulose 2-reductase
VGRKAQLIMPQTWKRAIIVGASSGIGEALVRALVADGCRVALVARREGLLSALAQVVNQDAGTILAHVYVNDVTDFSSVAPLFEKITRDIGGLDLIIYAAGIMPPVGPEEYDTAKDAETIAANFTGAVAWLNEAAKRFGKAKSGTIVGISSVAGDRGRRGNPVYGATKAAFNAYLESLRNRIEHRGAFVVTIKPGPVKTPMTEGLRMPGMISAEQAAAEILLAAQNKIRVAYVPGKWKPIMAVIRAIPAPIFKWLNI